MNITFSELRHIKHSLPTGSVSRLANEFGLTEQTVRNYFGAADLAQGTTTGFHLQPGPNGGIVHLQDQRILEAALRLIQES